MDEQLLHQPPQMCVTHLLLEIMPDNLGNLEYGMMGREVKPCP